MSNHHLAITYRSAEALIPYARNSRTHSERQVAEIAASIREFGWTNPILADGENGIIAGHGRLLAARKPGIADVPVIELAGLSEAQKRAYIIADNKLALNAGWDDELLALEFGDLASLGFDLSLTGFGEEEIGALLDRGTEGLTDPDDAPPAPALPVSRPADVWLMGNHRLLCGDSTNGADVEKVGVLMRGRKPQPTALKVMLGNPGKRPINRLEPKPLPGLPTCPAHLQPTAKAEWKRLAKQLHQIGVLTDLDRAALAAYCQAYGRWVEAERKLKETPPLLKTPAGYVQPSPWLAISNKSVELMHKFASELGLTPASRSRVSTRPIGPKPWEYPSNDDEHDEFFN